MAEKPHSVKQGRSEGTYVTVHAYTPVATQRAIAASVLCIDHGHLMDEATAKMMAEKGIWLSLQPFLDDEDAHTFPAGWRSIGKPTPPPGARTGRRAGDGSQHAGSPGATPSHPGQPGSDQDPGSDGHGAPR